MHHRSSARGHHCRSGHSDLIPATGLAAATQAIQLEGVEVLPLPLYNVLDGKNSDDYEQRVEPSVQGGQKMARAIMDCILAAR